METFGNLLSDIISLFLRRGKYRTATVLPLLIVPGTDPHSEMSAGFFVGNQPTSSASAIGLAQRRAGRAG